MKKIISFERAVQLSLLLFGLITLFHLAVIAGILVFNYVPLDYLWGGRMQTREQFLGFEIFSFILAGLCLLTVLVFSGRIQAPKLRGAARIALWALFFLFLLNTAGNIFAKTTFEQFFSIVTVLLAILCLRLAIE